jgi:malate dehydrogenase (oxaloacetate-decarboxylating)
MSAITKERLKKSQEPALKSRRLHPFYNGKIEITSKCYIKDINDFAIWYTPGVAEPCRAIIKDRNAVYENTNKGNTIAIITDGTRVLGLGDIGPEACLPAMEGKALLFKFLGGVDAYPICLSTKNAEQIFYAVKWIQPSFSGINLEDIATPKCFFILEKLREESNIPIWHDDQQGTATITTAGLINALKIVGKKPDQIQVVFIGAGAANISTSKLLMNIGVKLENMIFCDSKGILNSCRKDLETNKFNNPYKWNLCLTTNLSNKSGDMKHAIKDSDVIIAASKPGPKTIVIDDVSGMADDAIVFALANPIPEIWPWEAKAAGVRIVATGRSDFPNQINNSLVFPGMFRGALDVRASSITDEMCLSAAFELASIAEECGLHEEYLVPKMDDWEVYIREAVAVGLKAMDQGISEIKCSWQELADKSRSIINKARNETFMLMKKGFIAPPPDVEIFGEVKK